MQANIIFTFFYFSVELLFWIMIFKEISRHKMYFWARFNISIRFSFLAFYTVEI
jgi:hypothetical protein